MADITARTLRNLKKACYYQSIDSKLTLRAMLRENTRRRRSAKGHQKLARNDAGADAAVAALAPIELDGMLAPFTEGRNGQVEAARPPRGKRRARLAGQGRRA